MKLKFLPFAAAVLTVTGISNPIQAVTVDGIRDVGDGASGAFVNLYDLNARTRTEVGNAGAGVVSYGVIRTIRCTGLGTTAIANDIGSHASANNGVEMKLDLAALGVPSVSPPVKLMAVLVNADSTYGSNQVLNSKTSSSADIGTGINTFNFDTETGTQTITVNVTGPASRPVVFSVDMNQEIAKGFFNPTNHRVKADFFTGLATPTPDEIYLTDDNADGIKNGIECFMGSFNNQFTPNPAPVAGVITWPRGVDSEGMLFKVEVSDNLSTWQNAATAYPSNLEITGSQVKFTLPTGAGKIFTRLNVTP